MQTFVGLLILSLALAVSASPHLSRIVGGSDAPEGKYPYQVSLWFNGKFHCGGSILNERYILTAAHCLYGVNAYQLRVGIGSQLLNETVDFYASERLIPHYGFNPMTPSHDIGLIRLTKNIVYGDKAKPIPMAVQDFNRPDYPVVLTGWGRLYNCLNNYFVTPTAVEKLATSQPPSKARFLALYNGPNPNCLQEIELRIAKHEECQRVMGGEWSVGSNQICTFTKSGEGSCNGDSGGPLVVDGYQIGVVSWGVPCAVGKPDVFTRVHSYLDWIEKTVVDDRR